MIAPRLLGFAPRGKRRLTALTTGHLLLTASYVAQGVFIAQFLAATFSENTESSSGAWLLIGIVAMVFTRAVVFRLVSSAGNNLAADIRTGVRQHLLDTLLCAEPGRLLVDNTGKTLSTLVDAVEKLDPYITRFLPQVWASAIGFAAISGYLTWLDPLVGSIILGCGLLGPLVLWAARGYWDTHGKAWWQHYHTMYSEILDAIRGMSTLKAFNATRRHSDKLYDGAQAFCRESIRINAAEGFFIGVLSLLSGTGTAIAVGIGALRVAGGHLSGTELLMILILAGEAFRPLQELNKAYHASYAAWQATATIFESLDTKTFTPQPEPGAGSCPMPTQPPAVSFQHLCFSYPDALPKVLDDFCLDLAAGERVAVVGRSGSGKSTLVSLLLRFFDPDEGRILINGCDIRTMSATSLRGLISLVAQDTFLFHDTIRNNLLVARPSASDEELIRALQTARAADFVAQTALGLDTVVGERGMRLSGGQRQRLSIARAVLKDAPILILDEATSSIDTANEAQIQEALAALSIGRTTLVIAHRMSTVHGADRIIAIERGRLTQMITPGNLDNANGLIPQLFHAEKSTR